ncbi:MAG: stage 0 sporulation family protein [Oscillospiraceae bacterium]|nr:stage 0 sporulation family protein [Oscillospiraceae bacterium]
MEEQIITPPEQPVEVVDIQFRPGQKIYYFDPDGVTYQTGDHVIIDTARGAEFGICAGGNHSIQPKDVVAPLRKVLRRATAQDERIVAENSAKEKKAFEVCLQKIDEHGLDMQLVSAEVAFDGSKILFYFTADERVDFRELVKNLASVFHTRIELRQIGVRDKAKMVGGLGICGRPFCCATFLDDFQPVSIKMAKTQNLSLNPTKISGTCGRLMCCLKYEQDAYEDLIRTSPKAESFVDTPEGRGTVVEIDLLRQRVKVRMEDSPETISVFANTDIAVLRSGKAKKNDPPIPADLAPISGAGKRVRKTESEERLTLEPIRFRYSTEAVVEEAEAAPEAEETAAPEAPPAAEERERTSRRRSRRRSQSESTEPAEKLEKPEKTEKPDKQPKPQKEKKPKAPKKREEPKESPEPQPEAAEGDGSAQKKPRRRPNHRRYRKPKQSGESKE